YFIEDGIIGLIIAFVIWGILSLVAYFQGDSIMLSVARAKKISKKDHPRLFNIVEEMTIAAGLPKMPDVYIIDDPALNAFATGRDPNKAAVAVTSGLLQKLNRDELQGVIAHEMSHVKNRDVLLMTMAGVMLGTIVMLAWVAQRAIFFGGMAGSRRSSRSSSGGGGGGGGGQLIIMAIALVFMILAPIFAQLLYFAISRKREYLADASGALFTRYPEGLASALEKIGGSNTQLKSANKATAPMYISNPFRSKNMNMNSLTATHPSIADRIRVLRAMGGASFADYEQAYRKSHGNKGVIPQTAMAMAGTVPLAQPSGSTEPIEPAQAVDQARDTTQMLWQMNKYHTIDCPCGTRLRIPPNYSKSAVQCPHCGRTHQLK
ncbi:MAG: M48 family metallopeptidase, partial [Dehalococcoidales bacterium]|nr:M48 family metallopeptidase [Dehalococcoidales bacterium]